MDAGEAEERTNGRGEVTYLANYITNSFASLKCLITVPFSLCGVRHT